MHGDPKPQTTFSEPEAQRILARAAELEAALGNRFSTDELRQIAATAGIDARALEHAINESNEVTERPVSPSSAPSSESPVPLSPGRAATLAVAGATLGAMAVVADNMHLGEVSALAVFGPSAAFTMYRSLRHPLREGLAGLLRELALVFGSFTLGVMTLGGFQGVSPAMAWSLVCGALGSGILSLRAGSRVNSQAASVAPLESR